MPCLPPPPPSVSLPSFRGTRNPIPERGSSSLSLFALYLHRVHPEFSLFVSSNLVTRQAPPVPPMKRGKRPPFRTFARRGPETFLLFLFVFLSCPFPSLFLHSSLSVLPANVVKSSMWKATLTKRDLEKGSLILLKNIRIYIYRCVYRDIKISLHIRNIS